MVSRKLAQVRLQHYNNTADMAYWFAFIYCWTVLPLTLQPINLLKYETTANQYWDRNSVTLAMSSPQNTFTLQNVEYSTKYIYLYKN